MVQTTANCSFFQMPSTTGTHPSKSQKTMGSRFFSKQKQSTQILYSELHTVTHGEHLLALKTPCFLGKKIQVRSTWVFHGFEALSFILRPAVFLQKKLQGLWNFSWNFPHFKYFLLIVFSASKQVYGSLWNRFALLWQVFIEIQVLKCGELRIPRAEKRNTSEYNQTDSSCDGLEFWSPMKSLEAQPCPTYYSWNETDFATLTC